MKLLENMGNLQLSGKMALFFVALVLCQSFVSLTILTLIISTTSLQSLKSQMSYTLLSVEGYLRETFRDLQVKGELIAGQKKTIEYTDFQLKTLLGRELALFKDSLGIDSIAIFLPPGSPFAATQPLRFDDPLSREQLARSFLGESRLFISGKDSEAGLYVLSPIKRADAVIGVLSLSIRVDNAFIARIERIVGANVVFRFQGITIHGDALSEKEIRRIVKAYADRHAAGDPVVNTPGHIVGAVGLEKPGLPGGTIYCLLDTSQSMKLIRQFNLISLFSTGLILSLALVSGIAFYRRTFGRRFTLILQGIRKISGGDFNPPFELDWKDEFGQLVNAFDDMCRQLLAREKELKSLEEKLALSSKLAALGEMAAGVAHQVRNPLMVMKVSAEMLRDNYTVMENHEKYQKLASLMIDEADTLNLVVSNFLDFARPRKIHRAPVPVDDMIDFCLEGIPLERFSGITVSRKVQEGLGEYPMDGNLVSQALSNLVLNALQASPPGSTVEVRAGMDGARLCIQVQDWGEGIGDELRRSIFNPFFTTRDSGTGLGLSIVHRIIESHGGSIDVASAPGKGSTFTILL